MRITKPPEDNLNLSVQGVRLTLSVRSPNNTKKEEGQDIPDVKCTDEHEETAEIKANLEPQASYERLEYVSTTVEEPDRFMNEQVTQGKENETLESSKGVIGQDALDVEYTDDQEESVETEKQASCAKPKYGSSIVRLTDKFVKKVGTPGKEKETRKKKKWRAVNAEDMGFKLTLFPREPVTCDEKELESESKSFYAMIETELEQEKDQLRRFCHILQLEGTALNRETKFTRKDRDRRVQKAHKQVKSKDIISVLNNQGRKTLYIHFRIYKQHPFLHRCNLKHPNLPSPPRREGMSLDEAKYIIKAQRLKYSQGSVSGHKIIAKGTICKSKTEMVDKTMVGKVKGVAPKTVAEDIMVGESKTDVTDETSAAMGVAPKNTAEIISVSKTDVVDETLAGNGNSVVPTTVAEDISDSKIELVDETSAGKCMAPRTVNEIISVSKTDVVDGTSAGNGDSVVPNTVAEGIVSESNTEMVDETSAGEGVAPCTVAEDISESKTDVVDETSAGNGDGVMPKTVSEGTISVSKTDMVDETSAGEGVVAKTVAGNVISVSSSKTDVVDETSAGKAKGVAPKTVVKERRTKLTTDKDEAVILASKSKESETLSKNSLGHLARGVGKESDGLTLPMLLNLPTTTIINIMYENSDDGLLRDKSGSMQSAVVEKCVLMWRRQTGKQKNKERIKKLVKALREMGKNELADSILERYQNHEEITPDIFD
ncbi:uncharacterized protein LOC143276123 [Babylonia areolata]|uniref:uncharacterized protein LOC143276123 n=1 Tax=Babylonia areolata TaxID=304850 RepID=UPI003FD24DF0